MQLGIGFVLFMSSISLATLALHCVRFGLSWLVMRETGSAAAFAAIYSASSLVETYAKPLVSPLVDHFDRLGLMRWCMVGSTVVIAALWALAEWLPFSMTALAALLTFSSLIAAVRDPAAAALVPNLVKAGQIMTAQSVRSTADSTSGITGAVIAALLLATGGIPATFAAGAALSCAALAAMACVPSPAGTGARGAARHPAYFRTWHLRVAEGVRAVVHTRAERATAVAIAVTNAGLFPFFAVVMPLWITRDLDRSPLALAAVEAAFCVGIVIGSAGVTRALNRVLGRYRAVVLGNLLLGAGIATAATSDELARILACMLVGGIGLATFNINATALRTAATPAGFRGRMSAGVAFIASCMNPFSTQAFGALIDSSGATVAVAVSGALVLASTILLMRNADARSLLGRRDEEIVEAYVTLYPAAFAGSVGAAERGR
jgi:DHA3 family macrolide efflux protein-like MFS transporter